MRLRKDNDNMKFMLMTKLANESAPPPTPELMAAIGKFTAEMLKTGKVVSTGGLMPTSRGAKMRLSGGKITITDGPFAEAKECIGGYAVVQVNSKEEAIEMAREFLQIHADVMGPGYELDSEIRQMYEPGAAPGGN
jgi:hypothetical protein